MASIVKYYCDRQKCKKEVNINKLGRVNIRLNLPTIYPEKSPRNLEIVADLCPECMEDLRNNLSEFFNEGYFGYKECGDEIVKTKWESKETYL